MWSTLKEDGIKGHHALYCILPWLAGFNFLRILCILLLFLLLWFFSCQVESNSLWPHERQHARLLCPSPSPRDFPSSCPVNWWCHTTISSSVTLFSLYFQSFPVAGSFLMSQLFTSVGQRIGVQLQQQSFWGVLRLISFKIDWFDLLAFQGTVKRLLQHHSLKTSILRCSAFLIPALTSVHDCWKDHSLDYMDLIFLLLQQKTLGCWGEIIQELYGLSSYTDIITFSTNPVWLIYITEHVLQRKKTVFGMEYIETSPLDLFLNLDSFLLFC